ncbi:MAG: TatD family hydrolase [Anaerolineales bacterium]|nr:TatD family hydrolase [Anaerolineales bacterium]
MIDAHCHLDLYPQPMAVARSADRSGVLTICVTNSPSSFVQAQAHLRVLPRIRVALGLHPLEAAQHPTERSQFSRLIDSTSYVGEVGLDFSQEGQPTRDIQVESFAFVLRAIQGKPKFITLHSRRAERTVVEMLRQTGTSPAVFHWYSGSIGVLEQALADGHYFSINPAMIKSPNGQKITAAVPMDRLLTETDGPFISLGNRPAVPEDVARVESYLASKWNLSTGVMSRQIRENLLKILLPLKHS